MARHGSKIVRRRSCAGLLFGEFGTVLDSTVNGVIVQLLTALFFFFFFFTPVGSDSAMVCLRTYTQPLFIRLYDRFHYEVVLLKPSAVCVA